jgi:hypothetical protein
VNDWAKAQRLLKAAAAKARRTKIAKLAFDGASAGEIADEIGMSRNAVVLLAKRHGIPLGRAGATQRIVAWTSTKRAKAFAQMAEAAGMSPGAYVDRIIKVATDDPEGFRRFMGREGMPRRQYGGK